MAEYTMTFDVSRRRFRDTCAIWAELEIESFRKKVPERSWRAKGVKPGAENSDVTDDEEYSYFRVFRRTGRDV